MGGKRQLLTELLRAVDAAGAFGRYHEPFLGGGALFFALARTNRLELRSHLSDGNPNLMETYLGVRDHVDTVIKLLKCHKAQHGEKHFYTVRAIIPKNLAERAARIIYLNKTCFNGLYRENLKGQFNVPFGRYVNPPICDEHNLRAVSRALKSADLAAQEFDVVADYARKGDLVYFDPPYLPISRTADFTSYSKDKFPLTEHRWLAEISRLLARRGVHVIVSNSSSKLTSELYDDFFIYKVHANRLVNSKPGMRGKIAEALITSFPIGLGAGPFLQKRETRTLINSRGIRGLEIMLARQWLRENDYGDVADLIDEIVDEWRSQGKHTRRNWWEILAGDAKGNPRVVAGHEFPILRAAQLRQGISPTGNALCRNQDEEVPPVRVTKRWSSASTKCYTQSD